MPTPNERDKEVYKLLLSVSGRCTDLAAYREEIQRECAQRAIEWARDRGFSDFDDDHIAAGIRAAILDDGKETA
jgi:hypothetical protein